MFFLSFLAQVLWYENTLLFSCPWVFPWVMKVSLERKCIDVRGMFDGEEAKKKGFYYSRL